MATKHRSVLAATAFAALVTIAISTTALAVTLSRNGGPVTAVQTVTATGEVNAPGPGSAVVPNMTVNVSVPQGERALLIITFSAETLCTGPGPAVCHLHARIDGQLASPGEVTFAGLSPSGTFPYETNSMQFVAGPINAGLHTVDVRYNVTNPANATFFIGPRTLTVLRSKV